MKKLFAFLFCILPLFGIAQVNTLTASRIPYAFSSTRLTDDGQLLRNTNGTVYILQTAVSSGWIPALRADPGAHTSMTASTEFPAYDYRGATQTWAGTGTVTAQRWGYLRAFTAAAATAVTITDDYRIYAEPTVAGTNATITRGWGIGTSGNLQVQGRAYVGAASIAPTALLHLAAGTASANTAPLKLTSGTNLTTTEGGTMEFNGSNLFFTYTDGGTRNTVAMTNTNQTFSGSNLFTGTVGFGNTVSFADPADGTKILQNDFTGLTTSSTTHVKWATATDNTFVATGLRGSATLNFDLTAITSEDLTITVTGASDGDEVILGVPNTAMVANVSFTAWVSASNTVSVRCKGIVGDNPGSGTFKVLVIKR